MNKVEAIIVCKDYSDFLAETLPENLSQLDDIIVVTHKDDKATQAVCNKNSVHFITTDSFEEYGHVFNKGAAINLGLDQLRAEDWVLHLDADIVLCKDFRRMLRQAQLKKDAIYGADRINVYGYDAWHRLKPKLGRHYQDRWFVDPGFAHDPEGPDGTRFGTRVIHKEYGWVPIGFFQLWHSSAGHRYNVKRGAASGTDVLFPAQWPRDKRVLLPDVLVYHLDSELTHKMGTNWKGRKSQPFGPVSAHIPAMLQPRHGHVPAPCGNCNCHVDVHVQCHCHCHHYCG